MASLDAGSKAVSISKPVEASLWWDSFVDLFEELDGVPATSELPDALAKKLESIHSWLLDSIARFKNPNEVSKQSLNSQKVSLGTNVLEVKQELKDVALRVSACLGLDEIQSYILLSRSAQIQKSDLEIEGQENLSSVLFQYFIERQCLLKCIRNIFMRVLCNGNGLNASDPIRKEVKRLIDDGFERKILSNLQNLLSSAFPENTNVGFEVLWVEENLVEENLVLDILFLCYYESSCFCSIGSWKDLCSIFMGLLSYSNNVAKLVVSLESRRLFQQTKARLLIILIETLDLENLLRLVYDEVPYRQGASIFSLSDLQQIDAVVSSLSVLCAIETGPLILAWAVFLCLLLSLPHSKEYSVLSEIDHVGYVRGAFEADPFNYLFQILQEDALRDSDGPVPGFLSVLRTFISSFIASYELTREIEGGTLSSILDILCQIYQEESLSVQFWDKDSFVDGPIRSLLFLFESEFPFHTVELLRLLSALCEGTWSTECVFQFLNQTSGITTAFEISEGSHNVVNHDAVEIRYDMDIPGAEGLLIPRGIHGSILKFIDTDLALVRWKCPYSGVVVLLLRLAQGACNPDELFVTLNLLCKMVSNSKVVGLTLLNIDKMLPVRTVPDSGKHASYVRIDIASVICALFVNFVQDVSYFRLVSICIDILSNLLKCLPSHVRAVVLRMDIFGTENIDLSSGISSLSGKFARMLLKDCAEESESFCLASILEFTIQLLDVGAKDNMVIALVVFSLQYVMVNHIHWKYRLKSTRWIVTLKVFEVIKSCIKLMNSPNNFGHVVRDILLNDMSFHSILCQVMCISGSSLETLRAGHRYDYKEIENIQLSVCSAYNIAYGILSSISGETFSSLPSFVQTMLSPDMKPFPLVTAAASLTTYHHNMAIQIAAVRLLSLLCSFSTRFQPSFESVCPSNDSLQIRELRKAIFSNLSEIVEGKEDLAMEMLSLLASAARYQPAFLLGMILMDKPMEGQENQVSQTKEVPASIPRSDPPILGEGNALVPILNILWRSQVYFKRFPRFLLSTLNLLKALWEGGIMYAHILKELRSLEIFWDNLSSLLSSEVKNESSADNFPDDASICEGCRFLCKATILDIMSREIFFQEKLSDDPILVKQNAHSHGEHVENKLSTTTNSLTFKEIPLKWYKNEITDSLVKSFSMSGYDNVFIGHTKISISLCIVDLLHKMLAFGPGSLSVKLVEKLHFVANKLIDHPAFTALMAQYSLRGYSNESKPTNLILNDLYYHMRGQLQGREMSPGPFKELLLFLLELNIFESGHHKKESDLWLLDLHKSSLFDISGLRNEFQLELWDFSDWKESKKNVERMLFDMNETNRIMFVADSKHSALEALTSFLSVYKENMFGKDKPLLEPSIISNINYVCKCLQKTIESSFGHTNPPEYVLKLLLTQAELLFCFSRIFSRAQETDISECRATFILLLKTSFLGISFLIDVRSLSSTLKKAVKMFLLLLVTSVKFRYSTEDLTDKSDIDVEHFTEASACCFGSLPVLCRYVGSVEHFNLAIAALDVILKVYMSPNTWLPILQKQLDLQLLVKKIRQEDLASTSTILNLLLTLARVPEGAEMLCSANILFYLKSLLDQLSSQGPPNNSDLNGFFGAVSKDEELHIRGLILAIISSLIQSLGDNCYCLDIIGSITHYFSERSSMIFSFLSLLCPPDENHDKKRARTHGMELSLTALKVTEQILILICLLSKYQVSWKKGMRDVESKLREVSIHVLAFIRRRPPSLFQPSSKEEDYNGKPSFIKSSHGWFASSLQRFPDEKIIKSSETNDLAVVVKNKEDKKGYFTNQTAFSDMVAIQIYRIAFLLLLFLSIEARVASKRAEEVEFIDLLQFPELPMPDILHGLQDQAISIVTDICESIKPATLSPQQENICHLLLLVLEKSLYLELCVSQTCTMRPALGRIEDFSKGILPLIKVLEQQTNLKAHLRPLRKITLLLYPGLENTSSQI